MKIILLLLIVTTNGFSQNLSVSKKPMYFGQITPVAQVKEKPASELADSTTYNATTCPKCYEAVKTIYEDTIFVNDQYGFRKMKIVRCRFGTKQIRISNEKITMPKSQPLKE
ncbi:hypothetical protein [Spirosoma endbachense]|uniref:Uncharacterized protein n=1 Tax=Spirosoma endbachense TaxID=2666025 RepID=A0A6P1W1X4_9BACT|nr:hypothetical protein [Spirosoma endbachense]QHV99413.1 hypothetical protein GJR95_32325 [Spirosoma endbachense]